MGWSFPAVFWNCTTLLAKVKQKILPCFRIIDELFACQCWGSLLGCALIFISGEFGVVYKGSLQWNLNAATEVVAVKTLKGIVFLSLQVLLAHICTMKFPATDVTSGNVLGRYVLHQQKGWHRGRWMGAPEECKTAWVCLSLAVEWPWLALQCWGKPFLSSFTWT